MKNITVLELINKDMNAGLEGYMKIQSNRETIKSEFYYEPDLIGEAFWNLTVAE